MSLPGSTSPRSRPYQLTGPPQQPRTLSAITSGTIPCEADSIDGRDRACGAHIRIAPHPAPRGKPWPADALHRWCRPEFACRTVVAAKIGRQRTGKLDSINAPASALYRGKRVLSGCEVGIGARRGESFGLCREGLSRRDFGDHGVWVDARGDDGGHGGVRKLGGCALGRRPPAVFAVGEGCARQECLDPDGRVFDDVERVRTCREPVMSGERRRLEDCRSCTRPHLPNTGRSGD